MRRWMVMAAFLVACGGGGPPGGAEHAGSDEDTFTVVEVQAAAEGSVAELLVASATVESDHVADLFPVASGIVVSIEKDEGDPVAKGDVLATIDNVSLETGAERARTEVRRLQDEVERLRTLKERGAVSQRDLDEAEYQLETARSTLREASKSHGQTRITAPFDGVVATRGVRLGELATGATRAFQVVDLDALRVVAALPERDVARVHADQPARLVSAYDPDVWATGHVSRVSPVVDPTSGTFRVTVELDPGQIALRPGQYVSVEIEVDRHAGVLTVPRKGLVWEEGAPVVYRMIPEPENDDDADSDTDSKGGGLLAKWFGGDAAADEPESDADALPRYVAERVAVQVGLTEGDTAEITGGLQAGDQVVVVGQSNLKDGGLVRTPEMQAEAERRAAASKEEAGDEG